MAEYRYYIYSHSEDGRAWLEIGSCHTSWCDDRSQATGFLSETAAKYEAAAYNERTSAKAREGDAQRTKARYMKVEVPVYDMNNGRQLDEEAQT